MRSLKKRKYSRGGCKECKRRKMKCDEGKPYCFNCTRLKKACVYESKQRFRFENLNNHISSKEADNAKRAKNTNIPNEGFTIQFYNPEDNNDVGNNAKEQPKSQHNIKNNQLLINNKSPIEYESSSMGSPDSASKLFPVLSKNTLYYDEEAKLSRPSFKNNISDILSPNDLTVSPWRDLEAGNMRNLFDEASLLVNDINDLVNVDLSSQHFHQDNNYDRNKDITNIADSLYGQSVSRSESGFHLLSEGSELLNFRIDDFTDKIGGRRMSQSSWPSSAQEETFKVSNLEYINDNIKEHNLTEPHITYLKTLVNSNLSHNIFPFASSSESNEAIKLLLKYLKNCTYLLTSLLAMASTFQHNQTGKAIHDTSCQKYVSTCLKLLSDVFSKKDGHSGNVAGDIEGLLLTILVLTSNFTATSYSSKDNILNSWKTHLRGAKDLLLNYSKITSYRKVKYISGGLALAKTWFFAIEALAGLYSPQGGTLFRLNSQRSKSDLTRITTDHSNSSVLFADTGYFSQKHNPDYYEALKRLGLLLSTPDGIDFNLFTGFSMNVVYLIEEFTKILDYLRVTNSEQVGAVKIAHIMSLIHNCQSSEIAKGVCKTTFRIPTNSPTHPNSQNEYYKLPNSGYCEFKQLDGRVEYYSWFDISEQARVDSIYLRMLTTKGIFNLPRSHPLCKELLKKLMGYLIFFKRVGSETYERDKHIILAETEHYYISSDIFDMRCVMIQSAMRVCSRFIEEGDDYEKLELFFMGLVKIGNGSALSALDALYKYREKGKNPKTGGSDSLDASDGEDEELIEALPFA